MNSIASIFSLLFFLSEILLFLFKKSKKQETKINRDKNSTRVLWLVILIAVLAAIFVANKFPDGRNLIYLQWLGIVILILGFLIRWLAIYQLGKAFTVDVAIGKNHKITESGLYRTIRHPSYLGLMMEFLGMSLLFGCWYALFIVNAPIFLALHYRINIEEELLISYFGEEYERYKQHTKRLIPLIY